MMGMHLERLRSGMHIISMQGSKKVTLLCLKKIIIIIIKADVTSAGHKAVKRIILNLIFYC